MFFRSLVTCGGLGKLPKAPGTWGSLGAVLVYALLFYFGFNRLQLLALTLALLFIGVWAIRAYESKTGSEDAKEIVIDEWVGMGLGLIPTSFVWWELAIAFVVFRFFDIKKPLGIRYFDKNHMKGWGVMLDDVLAGVYTALVMGVVSEAF